MNLASLVLPYIAITLTLVFVQCPLAANSAMLCPTCCGVYMDALGGSPDAYDLKR